jgi:hypothetical protein
VFAKRSRSTACSGGVGEAVEVDGVLWGKRRRHALDEAVKIDSVLWAKRSRLRVK